MRHPGHDLQLDVHPGSVEFGGELDVLVQTGIQVGGDDDSLGEMLQNIRLSQEGRDVDVLHGLGHLQLLVDCSGAGLQIVWVLVGVETSEEDPEHQDGVDQREETGW